MEFIDCKAIAQKWKDEIKATGVKATLYVISAGDNAASAAYIKGKLKDAEEIGFECIHRHINADNRAPDREPEGASKAWVETRS